MESGRIIEQLVIDDLTSAAILYRRLPEGVTWIKTVLLYKVDEKGKSSTGQFGEK